MKKLSLEMLRLTSDEVLQRNQMKHIVGGTSTWHCRCGNDGPWFTVWTDGDPTAATHCSGGAGSTCRPAPQP
ncbi:hypothetical protein M3O96_05560 [Aquiflexum sp. TKW24L]|uniref:hypothetical protein n=1 Tax=Aquiflexum sp. TKW24L TaxID=2942212 RepID=UPI0020C004B0|nr:hypothetical protein [Aquiflexum sp. TKW24L]MCL6258544.1 hypothetical protein [Aquiflexum sp. TKW24L]